jgi:hypothetical protein
MSGRRDFWAAFWLKFWERFLSPATARFILALLSLAIGAYALEALMNKRIEPTNREALFLALGVMLGLSKDAFSYYFGSTARGDDKPVDVHVSNPAKDPVQTQDAAPVDGNQSAEFPPYKEFKE